MLWQPQEMVESVSVFPDHIAVRIAGAPPLTVLPREAGLTQPEIVGVGGGT